MAQFRGVIKGQKGEASRLGNKKTGMEVIVNGWNIGIKVLAQFDEKTGQDQFLVLKTGGSNNSMATEQIAFVKEN